MFKIFTRYLIPLKSIIMALSAAAASLIGAGIATAGSIGSGFINQGMNKKQFNRASAWNEKMYKTQLMDQRKLIQEQREYESPTQQLQRLRDAGLNPNLLSGAFGGPSTSSIQPVSAGSAPSVGSNPMPDFGSTLASGFSQFASGVDTSNLTQMKLLKGQAELEKLQSETEYQEIVNKFAEAKEKMTLAKGQQEIQESLARIKNFASEISLRNSTIELNGHKIVLIDKQADLATQNQQLAASKTFLTNLNAEKLQKLLPYVQSQAEAEFYKTRAQGEAAVMAANLSYEQASLAMVQAMKEMELLDKGYADAVISSMRADAAATSESARYYGYDAHTRRASVYSDSIKGIGQIVLGAAGIYFGSKVPNFRRGYRLY